MSATRSILGLGCLLVLLAGCGSDPDTSGPADPSSAECAEQRAGLVEDVRRPLQQATDKVMADPGGLQFEVLDRVAQELEGVADSDCVEGSAELEALVDLADRRRVGVGRILKTGRAFERWARSMGSPDVTISSPMDACPQMRREVRASFQVRREPEQGGVRVWLELLIENEGSTLLFTSHGGIARATHVRPDGSTKIFGWGGSSGDAMRAARPGRITTHAVGMSTMTEPMLGNPVHLFTGGEIEVREAYVSAYNRNLGPCELRVAGIP